MVDDLALAGAMDDGQLRAVQDGPIITARFSDDLPQFFRLVWKAMSQSSSTERLAGCRVGVLADDATDATQLFFARYRLEEEGATVALLGRRAGLQVRLSSPAWEWAEHGPTVTIDRALQGGEPIPSDDLTYDRAPPQARAEDLDGLVIPGGLGAWLIRGHSGLQRLICDLHAMGKPISAIERGPKVLLSAGVLPGRSVTSGPESRDDLMSAGVAYRDEPIVHDTNLLTCRGTEDLPFWAERWIAMLEIK
jgi:protease I